MTSERKAAGESSVHKDAPGRWHGYVSMGIGPGGRRDRRHVSGQRRADIGAKVRELEKKRDAGTIAAAGRAPTVAEWLQYWLKNIAPRRVRPRTLETYESTVRLHLEPWIGHQQIDKLQPEHLEKLYTELAAQGLSSSTILRVQRVLARALRIATQRGKTARNVALLVDPPAVKHPDIALPLTKAEARAVLEAARNTRNAARWTVALAVGLRQSETLGLRWSDIDLDAGKLSVKRGLHRVSGQGLVYEDPKSERSRRTIALPTPLIEDLRVHRVQQDRERHGAADLWEDHQLVFAQPNGRPIDRKSDWQAWKAVLKTADVRDVRLHDGRHTAATLLLSAGIHPRVVMELLGHSQMRTTTDTYSHVMPALAQEAADRMGNTLWDR
jgi:integrase